MSQLVLGIVLPKKLLGSFKQLFRNENDAGTET